MHGSLPTELKAARVLLFIMAGLAFLLFFILIVADADQTTLYRGFFSYLGQGTIALILGLLLARGGPWVLYTLCAFTGVVLARNLLTLLGGDVAGFTQMLLPGVILFLSTRPNARPSEANRVTAPVPLVSNPRFTLTPGDLPC